MPSQSVEFKFPSKGVMKNPAFNDLPLDAAADALNVLPWDTGGRMRLNQRTGTAKLFAAAMGNGSQTVTGMIQTTLALDPANLVADQQLVSETFSYGTTGGLGVVAPATWRIRNNLNGFSGTVDNTLIAIPASHDRANLARNGGVGASALYLPSLTLGTAYIVKMKVQWPTTVAGQASVNVRGTDGSTSAIGAVWDGTATLKLQDFAVGTIATATVPVAASATFYTLELQVNGNAFKVLINGVLYISTTSTQYPSAVGVGFGGVTGASSGIDVDDWQVFTGKAPASLRQTNIVSVCGGNVYEGMGDGTNAVATSGTAAMSTTVLTSMAYTGGIVYMVDGFVVKQLNLASQTVSSVVASAGTLPTNCTIAAVWRDRLILAAPRGTPQNFFMSRVGTPTDFDYSQVDSAAAFNGNASSAGHIGEPIVAVIPFSDDVCFVAGDHNLWAIRGDPADGGSIDLISDAIGILGAQAWTKSPDGTLYFAGTGGLYKIAPGSSLPENLSNKSWNDFFLQINRGSQYVNLAWDRDRQGCYVFVTPVNTGPATHLWYDLRTDSVWPIQFPDSHGPLSAIVYDGDGPTDRALLLGGRTGFVQKLVLTAKADDGTAISSYVYLGPVKSNNISDVTIEGLDLVFGEPQTGFSASDWNVDAKVLSAPSIEKAFNTPLRTRLRNFTAPRRQPRWPVRSRGNAFFLRLSNSTMNKTWSLESATAQMQTNGLTRRR